MNGLAGRLNDRALILGRGLSAYYELDPDTAPRVAGRGAKASARALRGATPEEVDKIKYQLYRAR